MRKVHLGRLLMNRTRATINNRSRMSQSLRTRASTSRGDKKLFIAMRVRRRVRPSPQLQIYCKAARL